jgi:hypothetical protein
VITAAALQPDCRCPAHEQEAFASGTDPEPSPLVFLWRKGVFLPVNTPLTPCGRSIVFRSTKIDTWRVSAATALEIVGCLRSVGTKRARLSSSSTR